MRLSLSVYDCGGHISVAKTERPHLETDMATASNETAKIASPPPFPCWGGPRLPYHQVACKVRRKIEVETVVSMTKPMKNEELRTKPVRVRFAFCVLHSSFFLLP